MIISSFIFSHKSGYGFLCYFIYMTISNIDPIKTESRFYYNEDVVLNKIKLHSFYKTISEIEYNNFPFYTIPLTIHQLPIIHRLRDTLYLRIADSFIWTHNGIIYLFFSLLRFNPFKPGDVWTPTLTLGRPGFFFPAETYWIRYSLRVFT